MGNTCETVVPVNSIVGKLAISAISIQVVNKSVSIISNKKKSV